MCSIVGPTTRRWNCTTATDCCVRSSFFLLRCVICLPAQAFSRMSFVSFRGCCVLFCLFVCWGRGMVITGAVLLYWYRGQVIIPHLIICPCCVCIVPCSLRRSHRPWVTTSEMSALAPEGGMTQCTTRGATSGSCFTTHRFTPDVQLLSTAGLLPGKHSTLCIRSSQNFCQVPI